MPELPDVEVFKQYVDATSLHQKIETVRVLAPAMLTEITDKELKNALEGGEFESTRRHGKYLFITLDRGSNLVLHFGMTGFLLYFKNTEKGPSHERLLISFSNGYHLAYDCQRKLGQVTLVQSIDTFLEERQLGTDALEFEFPPFKEGLSSKRSAVKSALMDQKLIAGIGNIYSDEILFQSGIRPQKKASQLDENALRKLFKKMNEVLTTAIESRADPEQFPEDYLIPHRRGERRCPKCGAGIQTKKVAGRTAYFCPRCQK
ncbi:MAG: Fpg/Nei family DNA glycosylase [Thermodesulfobacteriota bacterium]